MITSSGGRMLKLLWFIGFCGEFPSGLALRIGGHPEWNRHVMYQAIQKGYVTMYRVRYQQRVIRSLRITPAGIDYIGERDPAALASIFARQNNMGHTAHSSAEKIVRQHSLATGMLMAHNAGAQILPADKPSLLVSRFHGLPDITVSPQEACFYSAQELRRAIQEYDPQTPVKGSRITGIIVRGRRCWCLYHTGNRRMFWMRNSEENTVAAIETLLYARGFQCSVFSQVITGSRMETAVKIARPGVNARSRYFTVSDFYNNCFFVENSARGDRLLATIISPEKEKQVNNTMMQDFLPPPVVSREYDAVTRDGKRPVIINYQCDLLALLNINPVPYGFSQSPILLCFDYQTEALQKITGPMIEVRGIPEGDGS